MTTIMILERGIINDSNLLAVETNAKILKNNPNKENSKKLAKAIENFINIPITFEVVDDDRINMFVLVNYKNFLPELFKKKEPIPFNEKVSSLNIFATKELLKFCNEREITAIILHEIGHIKNHSSNIESYILGLIRLVSNHSFVPVMFLAMFFNKFIMLLLIIFIISRTSNIFEHINEYEADLYASEMGYGDDLAIFFRKISIKYKTQLSNTSSKRIYANILRIIFHVTHPDDGERICKIVKSMEKEYVEKYPPYIRKQLEKNLEKYNMSCKI